MSGRLGTTRSISWPMAGCCRTPSSPSASPSCGRPRRRRAAISRHRPITGWGRSRRCIRRNIWNFWPNIHTRWSRIEGASDEVIPNIHPDRRTASYPRSAVGQAGFHQADTACPIAGGTWEAAYWSAQTALSGADAVLGGARSVYALSRPPGHHAFGDLAGGFCFLNNAAIAAEHLLRAGRRPAILDVDVHHGNGTQGIFEARADVLTVSIHADPIRFYPFFWGHAHERGTGAGLGYNLNLPLERGTGDEAYLRTLDAGLARIAAFGADVLVVALGLDAFEGDPLRGLAVTHDGFARIGRAIAGARCAAASGAGGRVSVRGAGRNLTRFLEGVEGARNGGG
jgi:acetoin utilization deacetylase AcuC-like enzyme